jgi:hypothetical protein
MRNDLRRWGIINRRSKRGGTASRPTWHYARKFPRPLHMLPSGGLTPDTGGLNCTRASKPSGVRAEQHHPSLSRTFWYYLNLHSGRAPTLMSLERAHGTTKHTKYTNRRGSGQPWCLYLLKPLLFLALEFGLCDISAGSGAGQASGQTDSSKTTQHETTRFFEGFGSRRSGHSLRHAARRGTGTNGWRQRHA